MEDFFEYEDFEEQEENKEFEIKDAQMANWAINKIAEEKKRTDYFVECAEQEIKKLKEQIEEAQEKYERSTQFLSGHLGKYLEQEEVPKKKTKTQESVTLPAGKIIKKLAKTSIVRRNGGDVSKNKQNPTLVEDVESIDPSFVKVIKEVSWNDLKKNLGFDDDGSVYVKDTGEFIDTLTTCVTPPSIEVKPNE